MIRTYLDSGVLIALFNASHMMHQPARKLLSDSNREFVVSPFVELEVLPHMKRERDPNYAAARKVFENMDLVADVSETLGAAFDLLSRISLGNVDALHVGAALTANCDELVTTELPRAGKSIHRAYAFLRIVSI